MAFSTETIDEMTSYYPKVFRIAARLTRNTEDAKDLTQEAYLRVLSASKRGLEEPVNPNAYLCETAYKTYLMHRRADKSRHLVFGSIQDSSGKGLEYDPVAQAHTQIASADVSVYLRELFDKISVLSTEMQQAFWRFYVIGESNNEIALDTGEPRNTVKTRVQRARYALTGGPSVS